MYIDTKKAATQYMMLYRMAAFYLYGIKRQFLQAFLPK